VLTARKLGYWAEQTEIQAQLVTAWVLYAEGKKDEALAQTYTKTARAMGIKIPEAVLMRATRVIE
jgi:hypothetical protein